MIPRKEKMKVHFIGVGGIGMSAIANILISLGYKVTGSDLSSSQYTQELIDQGADIKLGHDEAHITDQEAVVYSSAIRETNPEMKKARELSLPIYKRAEILANLMRLKSGIAIAGTHGKTTTSSMTANVLSEAGLNPSYIVGGVVNNLGRHAQVGEGDYLVAETDESDGTFLLMRPVLSAVTNIDKDHLDHYGSFEKLKEAFLEYINNTPFYGLCVVNENDPYVKELIPKANAPIRTYRLLKRFEGSSDFEAVLIADRKFEVQKHGKHYGEFELGIDGSYNIENALAVICLADFLEIDKKVMKKSLANFKGAKRRMDLLYEKGDLKIIDDYAHHPTEIKAIVSSFAREGKDVYVFFEPHRYTRLRDHWSEFVLSFKGAKKVNILPFYSASEDPIEGISSENLTKEINEISSNCFYIDGNESFKSELSKIKSGVVLCLGAGRVSTDARGIVSELYK